MSRPESTEAASPPNRLPADCILLAAGLSSRMGTWKLLLPLREKTIIELSVENALSACERVLVVTGHRADELVSLFKGLDRVSFVHNAEFAEGMFSSIRAGAAAVNTGFFFIALGDMPFVPPAVYRDLYRAFCEPAGGTGAAADIGLRPSFQGKSGHPVLLRREIIPALLALAPSASMREVFSSTGFPRSVPTKDPGILTDIDYPRDFRLFHLSE